jgi:phosphatidylglycerophosphatase A
MGEKDPSCVVIDEVAGALIALGLAGPNRRLLSLILFRAFDIVKPGPINRVQRAEPAGWGIMADDLLAGAAAGISARLLWRRRRRAP